MAKKQTRRSLSLNRQLYEELKTFCHGRDVSVSQFAELVLRKAMLGVEAQTTDMILIMGSAVPGRQAQHKSEFSESAPIKRPTQNQRITAARAAASRQLPESTLAKGYPLTLDLAPPNTPSHFKGIRMRLEALGERLVDSRDFWAPTQAEAEAQADDWLVQKGYQPTIQRIARAKKASDDHDESKPVGG